MTNLGNVPKGKNTFCKEERLYRKILIDELFKTSEGFIKYPFRVMTLSNEAEKDAIEKYKTYKRMSEMKYDD